LAEANVSSSDSLDRSLASGIGWTAIYRWMTIPISLLVNAYVARTLRPSDFGLAAMAGLAIGFGKMIDDLGLDAVIVQDRTLGRSQIARLGGLAVLLGCSFALVYCAIAWPVAQFFHEPVVAWLIAALSLTFITDSLQIVPRALLQQRLQFHRLAAVAFFTFAVQIGSLALFATLGFSYWSPVLNLMVGGLLTMLVVNVLAPHPLHWPRQLRELTRPIGFAGRMIVSRISWYGYNNADQTIVGRVLGAGSLGAYQQALALASQPVSEVTNLVSRVVPGVFSEVQKDRAALRRYYLLLTEAITLITLPMCVGLALVSDDLIALVLGPQWGAAVTPLRILCIYLAVNSLSVLISHVLIWTGRAHMNMLLNLLSLAIIPTGLLVGVRYGLEGVAWAWAVTFPLSNVPGYWVVLKQLDLRFSALLLRLLPALQGCALMAIAVLLVRHSLPAGLGTAWRLGAQVMVGAVVYFAFLLALHRDRLIEMYRVARGRSRPVPTALPLAAEPPAP
jgi:O-antigen/teichoic acid export membrane protein